MGKKKGWTMYELETHEFFVSHDVKFFEQDPFSQSKDTSLDSIPWPNTISSNTSLEIRLRTSKFEER